MRSAGHILIDWQQSTYTHSSILDCLQRSALPIYSLETLEGFTRQQLWFEGSCSWQLPAASEPSSSYGPVAHTATRQEDYITLFMMHPWYKGAMLAMYLSADHFIGAVFTTAIVWGLATHHCLRVRSPC